MSSNTWTPDALSSNLRALAGRCWRAVEAQHYVSTLKLTDTQEEQSRLEELIEATKPRLPEECRHLPYLLSTPFRYGAPYPTGSRFRRAGLTAGVFYAAEKPRTAIAELTFYRLLFFAESPNTPWPTNPGEYTAFAASFATERGIDLSRGPFDEQSAVWTHPTNYGPCQDLEDAAREAGALVIRYPSARTREQSFNLALLSCRAFAKGEIVDRQTWRIHLSAAGARAICEMPRIHSEFDRSAFSSDPRIAAMHWNR
jgi:RES domain